ncbi:CCA tRNA nucleotidyltransferase [Anaerotruncus sp. 80]|uniref:CCA tRNA nucleotidyltransferase n=1 Tax=Anaerotruncus colihominis TaxID=169435 RepID=A0A845QPU4_9FIRM|nr:CCA tRNA nucleotidyltransferase [Anaerotruncus colihominis]NCF03378.1 CCA tRNA nucleotidyltransferase [Anaerotruncus sp. 80]
MIKFDKDVLRTLKTLEKEGFETYAAGECVRGQIMGEKVYDWDLLTKAPLADLQRIFPDCQLLDEGKQSIRLDFTYEVPAKDEDEPVVIDGCIVDVRNFEGTIEETLKEMVFTVNAIADNPERTLVDPYGGRDDIRARLIRTVESCEEVFEKEPIHMLEAVRIAAELDFDLHKSIFEAIGNHWRVLLAQTDSGDVASVREEFENLLISDHAGKGLKMLTGTGLMAVILGEDVAGRMSMSDTNAFKTVCDNIDKTRPVRTRRLGLVYTAITKKRALAAIERLQFDKKTEEHLKDGVERIIDINFLNTDMEFKKFLFKYGNERYNYLNNLSKAMRIVYDQPSLKIESRNYMMKKIISGNEPVFVEDLVIDANDIMEAGITDSAEKAAELLEQVAALVHKNPANNHRDVLLKYAKKYSKNKLAAKTRYVKWVK